MFIEIEFQLLDIGIVIGTHLFVKVPRPEDSEVTFLVFESSCDLYYQSNHSKIEAIPLSTLPKDTTSELASLSPHKPAKQESCEYQLLKSDSARESNPGLWTTRRTL